MCMKRWKREHYFFCSYHTMWFHAFKQPIIPVMSKSVIKKEPLKVSLSVIIVIKILKGWTTGLNIRAQLLEVDYGHFQKWVVWWINAGNYNYWACWEENSHILCSSIFFFRSFCHCLFFHSSLFFAYFSFPFLSFLFFSFLFFFWPAWENWSRRPFRFRSSSPRETKLGGGAKNVCFLRIFFDLIFPSFFFSFLTWFILTIGTTWTT